MKYSVVTWGTNDQYGMLDELGPTPQYRVRMLAESVLDQRPDAEVLVVDPGRGSDFENLPRGVRCIKIPPAQHQGHVLEVSYNGPFLWNHGIRQAQGEYVLACTADDFFMPGFFNILDSVVEPDALIICSKHYTTTNPVFDGKEYWRSAGIATELARMLASGTFPHDPFTSGIAETGHDMHLMHRDLWNLSRGYDERLTGWGFVDIQLCMRMASNGFDVINIAPYGAKMFHMDHARATPEHLNSWIDQTKLTVNGENWGQL